MGDDATCLDGLSAARRRQGQIIRPLLGFRKAELEQICRGSGLSAVRDPSNDNDDFDRVAMRQWLAATDHPFDVKRAVRTADAMADASEALQWVTEQLIKSNMARSPDGVFLTPAGLPSELQRRLLLNALAEIQNGFVPRGDAVDRTLAALKVGETVTLGNVLCQGGPKWHFRPAPKRQH